MTPSGRPEVRGGRSCGAAIALVCLGACASSHDYVTGEATYNTFGLAEEIEIGVEQSTLVLAGAEGLGLAIDPDVEATRTARAIIARILAVPENRARMPALPWELHVIRDDGMNAWCFPGGQVVLVSGLFERGFVEDEDEAAAVIGHEMAHAAARHLTQRRSVESLRRWLAPFGTFVAPRVVELFSPERPRVLIDALGKSASEFDQSQEIEADIIGLELMARAGYDPRKASRIWRRLARASEPSEPSRPELAPPIGSSEASLRAEPGEFASSTEDPEVTHPTAEVRFRELDRHLGAVAYQLARQRSPIPATPAKTSWRFAATSSVTNAGTLPSEGPLVLGAHVPSTYLHAPPELLRLGIRFWREDGATETRAGLEVVTARDLFEDHLRFSATLLVEPDQPRSEWAPVLSAAVLAKSRELEGPRVELRTTLPRLPHGRYRVRLRVLVGALWAERAESVEL